VDSEPGLYLYSQQFTSPISGQTLERTAFFCALKLVPYDSGIVLPHEHTKPAAKADRLSLMRATAANVEPIMGLYEDPDLAITRMLTAGRAAAEPVLYADVNGDTHQVWRVTDPAIIAIVRDAMRERRIWIADGHHRYETALTYWKEHGANMPGADRILIALIPFEDPGLVVLATHRMLTGMTDADASDLVARLKDLFVATPITDEALFDALGSLQSADGAFIVVMPGGSSIVRLREPRAIAAAAPAAGEAWQSLDVSILQTLLLDPLVVSTEGRVSVAYTRSAREAVELVRAGEMGAAFLVGMPSAHDVRQVTAAGDRMPPKSTFFHPKLWSGLIMRRLDTI
jgi:uncharacterized protein (DUF1015 family)